MHVIRRVHDLVHHWLDNEADLSQVRVALKHVDASLHGALHRRDQDVSHIQAIHLWRISFSLFNANWVKLRIAEISVLHDAHELCRCLAVLSLFFKSLEIKHRHAMSHKIELSCL